MGDDIPFLVFRYDVKGIKALTAVYPDDPATGLHKEIRYTFTEKGIFEQTGNDYPKALAPHRPSSEDKIHNTSPPRYVTFDEMLNATGTDKTAFEDASYSTAYSEGREFRFISEADVKQQFAALAKQYPQPTAPDTQITRPVVPTEPKTPTPPDTTAQADKHKKTPVLPQSHTPIDQGYIQDLLHEKNPLTVEVTGKSWSDDPVNQLYIRIRISLETIPMGAPKDKYFPVFRALAERAGFKLEPNYSTSQGGYDDKYTDVDFGYYADDSISAKEIQSALRKEVKKCLSNPDELAKVQSLAEHYRKSDYIGTLHHRPVYLNTHTLDDADTSISQAWESAYTTTAEHKAIARLPADKIHDEDGKPLTSEEVQKLKQQVKKDMGDMRKIALEVIDAERKHIILKDTPKIINELNAIRKRPQLKE